VSVPTADANVRFLLRKLHLPVCLFGEGPGDRRERLKAVVMERQEKGLAVPDLGVYSDLSSLPVGYQARMGATALGPDALLGVRIAIARDSLLRASQRLSRERNRQNDWDDFSRKRKNAIELCQTIAVASSQVGDQRRALSAVSISDDGKFCATGSWTGAVKLWSLSDCMEAGFNALEGHAHRVADVCFLDADHGCFLASGATNGEIKIWNLNSSNGDQVVLKGHKDRVSRLVRHRLSNLLLSSSFDLTWRMWDLETKQNVLVQSGHSRPVYGLAAHPDGGLAFTGDLGAGLRVWDLRTGHNVCDLKGHSKGILSIRAHYNGYTIASAGEDNTARIWDIRQRKVVGMLTGHLNLVSDVHFFGEDHNVLATVSFDRTMKFWDLESFSCLKSFQAHEDKVMRSSLLHNAHSATIVTVSSDRTWKLWSGNLL